MSNYENKGEGEQKGLDYESALERIEKQAFNFLSELETSNIEQLQEYLAAIESLLEADDDTIITQLMNDDDLEENGVPLKKEIAVQLLYEREKQLAALYGGVRNQLERLTHFGPPGGPALLKNNPDDDAIPPSSILKSKSDIESKIDVKVKEENKLEIEKPEFTKAFAQQKVQLKNYDNAIEDIEKLSEKQKSEIDNMDDHDTLKQLAEEARTKALGNSASDALLLQNIKKQYNVNDADAKELVKTIKIKLFMVMAHAEQRIKQLDLGGPASP